jgi:hypothetical protein
MGTRSLPLTNAALERVGAAEPAIDECAEHGENRHPCDRSDRDTVEFVAEPGAAQHGGSEHQHDHDERRTLLVLDMSDAANAVAKLVAAQGIGTEGVHSVLQTVMDLWFRKSTQSETQSIPE